MIDGFNVTEAVTMSSADLHIATNKLVALGAGHVRIELPGVLINPQPGVYNWTKARQVVDTFREAGVEPLMILGVHAPKWWSAADFGNYCYLVEQQFGPGAFEIWNEPNLHAYWPKADAAKYVGYLMAARHNLTGTVVFGGCAAAPSASGPVFTWQTGLTWYTNKDPLQFVKDAYAAGAKGFFDVMGYHPYSRDSKAFVPVPPTPDTRYINRAKEIADLMVSQNDPKPMRLTEWGFGTDKTLIDAAAQYVIAQDDLMRWPFVSLSYLFSLRDNVGGTYGIYDHTWAPKQPYWNAVANLVRRR